VKVPLSWLREFVAVPGTAEEIAATMSLRGFAVEGIEPNAGDPVIDFEVTANRPDCMSVVGIAREVATACGLPVRRPAVRTSAARETAPVAPARAEGPAAPEREGAALAVEPAAAETSGPGLHLTSLKSVERGDIEIAIEQVDLCPRYAGAVADVTVGDSPAWLQARLRAAGVRPISNIVDVTNYVLLELGHPMHAFDHARLGGGEIRVRTARAGETIRTIDGQMRTLDDTMLVIADADRPVAVAGVMGGADTEVTAATTTIVLESAYFNPLSVRRTSKRLGLKTEASMRFERGADPRLPVTAMERACALLEHIGAGKARGTVVDRHASRIEPRTLRLRRARLAALLGVDVPDSDVRRILDSLGFAPREADEGWDITVPTRRVDVAREVDLVEEVARHFGFDRIPATFPPVTAAPPAIDPRITQAWRLRAALAGAGFSEAVTFGFIGAAAAASFAPPAEVAAIANPLSETFAVLRPSILPGLIEAVAHNRRREQRDVRLFEIGARFSRTQGERRALALAWTGAADHEHWSAPARDVDLFDVKGVIERIADLLGVDLETAPAVEEAFVPGRTAVVTVAGRRAGVLGQLVPALAARHDIPPADALFLVELDLDALDEARGRTPFRVQPLPQHPSVTRDISVLVDDSLPARAVRETIREAAPAFLVRVREFDRYQGKGIPAAKVSLSLRLVFRAPERTLTDAEVQQAMDRVMSALADRHGAVQR
jgi:phenylalanyl-tRNA synthetase beta chain